MVAPEDIDAPGHVHVNARRLWAGGIATAVVAALAVVAGVLIARGVLGIPVLAPKTASNFGNSSTAVYAALAAGCALLATALLHVLLLGTPRPLTFFAWITALADVVVAAAPFTQPARSSPPSSTSSSAWRSSRCCQESDAAPSGLWTYQAQAGRSALAGTPASDDGPMAHRSTSRPGIGATSGRD